MGAGRKGGDGAFAAGSTGRGAGPGRQLQHMRSLPLTNLRARSTGTREGADTGQADNLLSEQWVFLCFFLHPLASQMS